MSNFFNSNVKSFVLRSGRVTSAQKRALRAYSGLFCIPFSKKKLPPEEIFGNSNPVVLDIGFGMGHEIVDFSTKNSTKNLTKHFTKHLTNNFTKNVTKKIAKNLTHNLTKNLTANLTRNIRQITIVCYR